MSLLYDIFSNEDISFSKALKYTKLIFYDEDIRRNHNFKISLTEKEIKKINQYSHPYYWAPFQLSTIN